MEAPRDDRLSLLEPSPGRAAAASAVALIIYMGLFVLAYGTAGVNTSVLAALPTFTIALCYRLRVALLLYGLVVLPTSMLLNYHLVDGLSGFHSPGLLLRIITGAVLVLVLGGLRHVTIQLRRTTVSTRYLDDILKSLADMLLVVDGQGIVVKANEAASKAFGPSVEALVGRNVLSLLEDRQCDADATEQIQQVLRRGVARTVETHLEVVGQATRLAMIACSPLQQQERGSVAVVLTIRDITQQRRAGRLEKELELAAERARLQTSLAQADRMASVGKLAAGVAHEINNPLAYVMINLESLGEDLPRLVRVIARYRAFIQEREGAAGELGLRGEEREMAEQEMLDDILDRVAESMDGARRVRNIVRDLKAFSDADSDRRGPLDLNQVVESAINMAATEIKYRAQLQTELGELPEMEGNEGRLCQVFLNLLVNAAQALEEGHVDENTVLVRTWVEGRHVCAEVSDTGRGIKPEHLARIFDPFFTTKEAPVGTGLGLSICHGIVEAHGGEMEVHSDEGKGTRFVVRLPRDPQDPAGPRRPVSSGDFKAVAGRGRILVVDDDEGVAAAVRRTLSVGHEVEVVSSGAAAKEVLRADQAFDMIVCDLMMPAVTGMDLYQWLESWSPALAARMVFLTGGSFTPRARAFQRDMADRCLEKPFHKKQLSRLVNKLLDGPRPTETGDG